MQKLIEINNISEAHEILGLPKKPLHPLVTIINPLEMNLNVELLKELKVCVNLYQVWMNDGVSGTVAYGRNEYDFQDGTLAFLKPGQVLTYQEKNIDKDTKGWGLLFHPDLIRKSSLGMNILDYTFFDYDTHEALHISEREKDTLHEIKDKIIHEYSQNIDKHSQKLIVTNIELLLDYSSRYYDRQFYTRTNLNKDILTRFDDLLKKYYKTDLQLEIGLPTVKYCAEELNMSPNYLGDLLKKESGHSAQERIHTFVIERAKNLLLSTNEPVNQIAYGLGYEYPQHFNKIFKSKTGVTPATYRKAS
jgi:AraC-like DNA-binding protein